MEILSIVKNVPKMITQSGGRTMLLLKKESPAIFLGVGIASGVASTVLACRATLKVSDILDDHEDVMNDINYAEDNCAEGYSHEDAKKDRAIATVQTGAKIAKLYLPAVALGATSIGCVIGGHSINMKRNAALAAAYTVVDGKLKEYRKRVTDEYGEEVEKKLYYGLKSDKIQVEEKDPETGKVKKVKKQVNMLDPTAISQYARFFDDGSVNWVDDAELNLCFLKAQQNYMNDLLHSRGHVFLNEVYDALGIPRTKAGAVVGWVMQKGNDNFVDFGIYSIYNQEAMDFVNGYEKNILLDFNVDGVIYDLI